MLDFSIVIPTYNSKELLIRALFSVINQKGVCFEIIIIDDSTNNEIEDYVNTLSLNCLRYIHNCPSLGAVKNWNFGISLANGENIILLHHDECFCDNEHHLQTCMQKLNMNYEIIISNISVRYINGKKKRLLIPFQLKKLLINIPSFQFFINLIGPVSCVAFKREIFEEFDTRLKWYVDVEWFYRILNHHRYCLVKNLNVESLHGHSGQITLNINLRKENANDKIVLKEKYKNIISIILFLNINSIYSFIRRFIN